MRIAVVGSGISGLASAWWLSRGHEVVLFESEARLGGHTHTHTVYDDAGALAVDTGFIVFNPTHYPLLTALFDELGVASRETTMSFSVHRDADGLEYNAGSLSGLFCQPRNLASPAFWGMLRDLVRFYRQAPALLDLDGPGPTLGEYLRTHRYGATFRDAHLVPMACALWSSPSSQVLDFPAQYLVRFMANHRMLDLGRRAPWRTVVGGSSAYVDAMRRRWRVDARTACPVFGVRRDADAVEVVSARGVEHFDHVVLACHSDQALALLQDPGDQERALLSSIRYQANDVALHTDTSVLPRRRAAWAAWNAHIPEHDDAACTVSYCMNLLQGLQARETYVVTLNRTAAIAPDRLIARMRYAHPVYDHAMVAAQRARDRIQGHRRTWFAGAYWGWGFHEDGIRSARDVVAALDPATLSPPAPLAGAPAAATA